MGKSSILLREVPPAVSLILAVALIVLTLWLIPEFQTAGLGLLEDQRLRLENELRTTLALILGGGLVLLGLYFAWRRLLLAQETERFTKAIEQLGSEKIEIRLGGIFAMERIARLSIEKDDRSIIEVLTAYVRENSWKHTSMPQATATAHSTDVFTDNNEEPIKPQVDIQAVLSVLGRGCLSKATRSSQQPCDLSNSDLRNIDLSGCRLKKADMTGSTLQGASLGGASLEGASFYRADLEGADLSNASLEGACFIHANLKDAHLPGAKLKSANFLMANMTGALLKSRSFNVTKGRKVKKINIDGADLSQAVGLSAEQIKSAIIDSTTKLPPYIDSAKTD